MFAALLLAAVSAAATPAQCNPGNVRLVSAGSQGAAGTLAEQFRMVPRRGVSCVSGGYPDIELIGTDGKVLDIKVGHLTDDLHPVRTLTFSHHRPARFDIRHPSFNGKTGKPCKHRVAAVRVFPPNQAGSLKVSLDRPLPRFCTRGAKVTPVGRRY